MKSTILFFFMLASFVLFTFTSSYSNQQVMPNITVSSQLNDFTDKTLVPFQSELLDLAFDTATSIPIKPHIKDRSRAQEDVVNVSLKLDQPKRALDYIKKIDDWRRGEGYGDLAFYLVQHGHTDVQSYLDLATEVSQAAEDWRRDSIKVKIAKTFVLMGETQKADQLEKGVEDSQSGKVAAAKAMTAEKESFDEQMKALDKLIATDNFDTVKNALESSTDLFNRFYDHKDQRTQVEKKIKASWNKMPYFVRIDLLMKMGSFALDHKDQSKALGLVNEAQDIADGRKWPLEYEIPMKAKLDELRFRSGDKKKAKRDADSLWAGFEAKGKEIVDIYRAGALRPLAEAYQTMGDTAAAIKVYKRAVEESVVNPNSRPRAEDLAATLSSMALHGVEPDAELWAQIRTIKNSLGNPW